MSNLNILKKEAKELIEKHQDTIVAYYKEQPIQNKIIIKKALKRLNVQIKDIS